LEQNNQLTSFIEGHPLFSAMDYYSIPLRENIVGVLLGLGLPVPALHRKELWGYERDYDRHIYFPIQAHLEALYTALEMSESGDYHTDDIVAWLVEATKTPLSKRNFFNFKKDRPLYSEFKLSLEERINIFNGISAPPSTKEAEIKKGKRQAYHEKRTREASQGDGEAEGTSEAGNSSSD
jgi:hypothetical protein